MFLRGQIWWTKIRHDGKKVEKSLGTRNRKSAQAIEAKIRTEIIEGSFFKKPKGNKITVAVLIDKYLAEHSKPNKGAITYKNDIYFSKRILQCFGKKLLSDVKPSHKLNLLRIDVMMGWGMLLSTTSFVYYGTLIIWVFTIGN